VSKPNWWSSGMVLDASRPASVASSAPWIG
jgi:hypothetical protein